MSMRTRLLIALVALLAAFQPLRLLAAGPITDSIPRYAQALATNGGQVPVTPPVAPHRGRGFSLRPVVIGAIIGAGLGGWLSYEVAGCDDNHRCASSALKGGAGGALFGAAIGFVIATR
jgi:hypothetical protein